MKFSLRWLALSLVAASALLPAVGCGGGPPDGGGGAVTAPAPTGGGAPEQAAAPAADTGGAQVAPDNTETDPGRDD